MVIHFIGRFDVFHLFRSVVTVISSPVLPDLILTSKQSLVFIQYRKLPITVRSNCKQCWQLGEKLLVCTIALLIILVQSWFSIFQQLDSMTAFVCTGNPSAFFLSSCSEWRQSKPRVSSCCLCTVAHFNGGYSSRPNLCLSKSPNIVHSPSFEFVEFHVSHRGWLQNLQSSVVVLKMYHQPPFIVKG